MLRVGSQIVFFYLRCLPFVLIFAFVLYFDIFALYFLLLITFILFIVLRLIFLRFIFGGFASFLIFIIFCFRRLSSSKALDFKFVDSNLISLALSHLRNIINFVKLHSNLVTKLLTLSCSLFYCCLIAVNFLQRLPFEGNNFGIRLLKNCISKITDMVDSQNLNIHFMLDLKS